MKTIAPGRKRLLNNAITYAMVIIAFVVLQLLNAGGMLSPSLHCLLYTSPSPRDA